MVFVPRVETRVFWSWEIRIRNKYTITNNKYYYQYNIIMIKCNIAKSKKLTILSYDSYDGQNPLELV